MKDKNHHQHDFKKIYFIPKRKAEVEAALKVGEWYHYKKDKNFQFRYDGFAMVFDPLKRKISSISMDDHVQTLFKNIKYHKADNIISLIKALKNPPKFKVV